MSLTAFIPTGAPQILPFVGVPGVGTVGHALVWSETPQGFTLAPINSLSGATPLTFSTGPTAGTIRERARIHPNGTTVYSSDGVGAFAVASFGKDLLPDNTVTPLAKFVASTNSVYGLVHAYFSLVDYGWDLYLAERIYKLFWNGSTLLFTELSNLGFAPARMVIFSVVSSGNTVTISGTYDSVMNYGWGISMAFQWIPYSYDLANLSIEKA